MITARGEIETAADSQSGQSPANLPHGKLVSAPFAEAKYRSSCFHNSGWATVLSIRRTTDQISDHHRDGFCNACRVAKQLARLAELCRSNAEALLLALRFCAAHGIGSSRILSSIMPIKTHPAVGYRVEGITRRGRVQWRSSNAVVNLPGPISARDFIPINSSC